MKKLLLLAFLLISVNSFAQEIHFTVVQPPPAEMPWQDMTGVTQDPQGYLWMSSYNGVYKYDGHQYIRYQYDPANPNSLGFNWAETIFADHDGVLWIGLHGAGLDRYDPLTNKFTHYHHEQGNPKSIASDFVIAIIRDKEGTLWLGTHGGLDKFEPGTGTFKHFTHRDNDPNSLSCNQVRALYEDRAGTIWVGAGSAWTNDTPPGEGGLNKFDKKTGRFTRYMHNPNDPSSLEDNRVGAIFEDSHGTFWVGTAGDGLHTMDRKTGKFEHHFYDHMHPEKLSRPPVRNDDAAANVVDHITFISEDILGKIWIGTFENGISIYDPSTQKTQWFGYYSGNKEKIINKGYWRAFRSRDGTMWVSSLWEHVFYKVKPFQINVPHRELGKTAYSFIEDTAGTLWVATQNNLIQVKANDQLQSFSADKKISWENNSFTHIDQDNRHNIWLASTQGLYSFDPVSKALKRYDHKNKKADSLLSDNIPYIKPGSGNTMWVGTSNGLDLLDTKTGLITQFINPISHGSNVIDAIQIDKKNNVWVATNWDGVDKLDVKTKHFKRYLKNLQAICLLIDDGGYLWVGTGSGLYKYDQKKDDFLIVNPQESASVYYLTEDHQHDLWLFTLKGIEKFDPKTNQLSFYGKNQGLDPANLSDYGYTRHNGEILAGSSTGYFSFKPANLAGHRAAPTIVFSQFLLADVSVLPVADGVLSQPLAETKEIRLSHNQATFSFGYTAIDFVNEEGDTHIYYKLENYESKWRKGTSDQIANYYNVQPGNYVFKVKSVDFNGITTEKSIAVIVSPPWWQTWWAYAAYIILFAVAIPGIVYYRARKLRRENQLLEEKVGLRTRQLSEANHELHEQQEEITTQRDELEKAFNDLKTTQTQLIQSEKMASLGELTAGIAHEIQNPLNFVNNFSEVSIELLAELKEEEEKGNKEDVMAIADDLTQNLEKIRHHGKRADGIVKGMLEHSRASTGQKELTDINKLTDEYLRLAYHGLRAKDKNFNAELITDFDEKLPIAKAIPQDIGRVLLNIFNNAFYATNQKAKSAGPDYRPEVTVITSIENGQVIIKVKDNGNGIPDSIKDKIMQPFFTTKPTGEGTGLGLSLSYDIVVKGHGGSINVDTKEGEFTEFVVRLPL